MLPPAGSGTEPRPLKGSFYILEAPDSLSLNLLSATSGEGHGRRAPPP